MRTHHFLTLILCSVFVLGSTQANAQPPGSGYASFNSHAPVDPSGVPAGFNPYPAISPFEHAFSSTYNQNGLWLSETSNEFRSQTFFSLEAVFANFKGAGDELIGTSNVVSPFFDPGDQAIDNDDAGRSILSELNPLQEFNNGRGPFSNMQSGLIDQSRGTGLRGTLGIERPDGVGIEFSGMWISPQWSSHAKGYPIQRFGAPLPAVADTISYQFDGIPGYITDTYPTFPSGPDPDFPLALDVLDMDSVTLTNPGIGLDDGSVLGTIQRFDLYMKTSFRSELYDASISLIQAPTRQIGFFKVRPMLGVRYLNPVEQFTVEGHDSGADYVYEEDADDVVLPGGIEDTEALIIAPYRAYIDSRSETHLGGAELGWKYFAGGDHFSLDGETKFGVMGGQESLRVWTKGIGQPFLFNQADEPLANINLFYDPELETVDTKRSSYVTPTFQQSFNTTSRPFAYVPVLRNMPLFAGANLKAGWTFLLIGQLQRPNEQILYQSGNGAIPPGVLLNPINLEPHFTPEGDPSLKPSVKKNRGLYFVNYFNLGVEWEY